MPSLPQQGDKFESFFDLSPDENNLEERLEAIFSNLYYTWDKDLYEFIDKLDGYNWRKTKSPATIIHRYIEEHRFPNPKELESLDRGIKSLQSYLNEISWFEEHEQFDTKLQILRKNPILYLGAEYGLVDWLQIYSGGLGVLAGDFVKQASDHGLPLVGVGIFYNQGYFHQDIGVHGMQHEHYIPQDPAASMLKLVRDKDGKQVEIKVTIIDHDVYVRAWELKVGHNSIYLLDTNFSKNQLWEDRMITAHLYGGDEDTRIRQEIVLGIGGYRFVKALGIRPSIIHLNEGHASFAQIERILDYDKSMNLSQRIRKAKSNILFTNHTLNAAGNDKFEFEMFEKYIGPYADDIGLNIETIFNFGNDQLYSKGLFSMTIMGLKGSKTSNAVSQLHGKAAVKLWPDYPMEAVTNGVHMPTWVGKPIQELLETHVDKKWTAPLSKPNWDKIFTIPDEELWNTHVELKKSTIERINQTLGVNLDPNKLTIVWTRRFAAYKRPDIFLNDLNKLRELLDHSDKPIQFLIGGKAHPRDTKGKELLQKVIETTMRPEFKDKIVFLTAYNWNLARYIVAGADVWLNNPIRFEEASGTSGMKAGANGVLQFTTLDGWTDEVNWGGKGWVLPQENINSEIYRLIEQEIAPTYYSDNEYPKQWVKMMKETMKVCLGQYNMGRMLEEYIELYKGLI